MSSPVRRAPWGVNGWPIWCGVALAFYVAGLRFVARRESFRGPVPFWPLLLLAAPVFLAMLMNAGEAWKAGDALFAGADAVGRAVCAAAFFSGRIQRRGSSPACWRELFLWTGWPSRRKSRTS